MDIGGPTMEGRLEPDSVPIKEADDPDLFFGMLLESCGS